MPPAAVGRQLGDSEQKVTYADVVVQLRIMLRMYKQLLSPPDSAMVMDESQLKSVACGATKESGWMISSEHWRNQLVLRSGIIMNLNFSANMTEWCGQWVSPTVIEPERWKIGG